MQRRIRFFIINLLAAPMLFAQAVNLERGALEQLSAEEQIYYLLDYASEIFSSSRDQSLSATAKAILLADSIRNLKLYGDALFAHSFAYYRADDTDSSLHYTNKSLLARQQAQDSVGIGQSLNRLGNIYWRLGQQVMSKEYHGQAFEFLKNQTDYEETGKVLNNLANIYSKWGVYDEALHFYTQALDNYQKADFNEGIAWLNFSLTMFYKKLGNFENALESVRKSLEIYSRMAMADKDSTGVMLCFGQLGDIYLKLGQFQKGLDYHIAALKLRNKSGVPVAIADGLTGVGQAMYLLGRYTEAISYIDQSMTIEEKALSKGARATNLKLLGSIHHELGNNVLALTYLFKGLERTSSEKNQITKREILKKISEIFADQGKHQKAYTYLKKYIAATDSTFNSEVSNRVASMQLVFEMKEKTQENDILIQNNRIQELEIEKSYYIRNLLLFAIFVFISAILLVIYLYLRKIKVNRVLQSKNDEIEKTRIRLEQEIEERRKIEIEREKLIGELQDSIKKIKTLRGLIPICASCKNIRNDQGYYMKVEEYVMKHSDAVFSHGICPDCSKKLLTEIKGQRESDIGEK